MNDPWKNPAASGGGKSVDGSSLKIGPKQPDAAIARNLAMAQGLESFSVALDVASSIAGGYAQSRALKRKAAANRANAAAANLAGAGNSEAILRAGRMALGAQAAGAAQNGLGFSGSVSDSLAQSAGNVAFDSGNAVYAGLVQATDFNNQASADTAAAKNAVTAGWIGAATKMLKAGAQMMTGGMPIPGGS